MKKRIFVFSFLVSVVAGIASTKQTSLLKTGNWRGILTLNDSTMLPFTFDVGLGKTQASTFFILTIKNAEERIIVENLLISNDSVNWNMPVFDSWFKCKRESDSTFSGIWFNNSSSRPYQLKFRAEWTKDYYRISKAIAHAWGFNGKYETTFSPNTIEEYKALGQFETKIVKGRVLVTGTFATETGDYRFLEGQSMGHSTIISCFDGSHAFLFKFHGIRDTIHGDFYSGKRGYEKFYMIRNDSFQLRDPEKLTYIKDSSNINFTFNDLNGNPVSLSDEKFRGKVVIVQITGSWCPNCMDETEWMSGVYKKYNSQGLEIIALAYERSADTSKANPNIRRVKNHFDADYTFLNTGRTGKDSASASLPFLNGIMSFPTTIYIDRNGKVRMVYTGYNGPATGALFEKDSAEALRLIQQMLAEKKIKN